jgi:putative spermidine/putrescine transport system permease protein
MERPGGGPSNPVLAIGACMAFVFLMLPSVIVVILSFSSAQFLSFPPPGFSLQWYAAYFRDWEWIEATARSATVAVAVTVLATALGAAASLALVRYPVRGAGLLYLLLISPIIVPTIVLGISMYSVFVGLHLIGGYPALILAHTVLATPFVVMNVTASLHGFDRTLERAAWSMGASPLLTFRKVVLPLIGPGVFNGAILAFITSFDEIVITIFLAGSRPTLPKKMYDGIQLQVSPTLTAVSTIFIVTSAALLLSAGLIRRTAARRMAVQA